MDSRETLAGLYSLTLQEKLEEEEEQDEEGPPSGQECSGMERFK